VAFFGDPCRSRPVAGPAFELTEVEQHRRERSLVGVLDVVRPERLEELPRPVEVVGPLQGQGEW
jgi:hypothetical protein